MKEEIDTRNNCWEQNKQPGHESFRKFIICPYHKKIKIHVLYKMPKYDEKSLQKEINHVF